MAEEVLHQIRGGSGGSGFWIILKLYQWGNKAGLEAQNSKTLGNKKDILRLIK